MRGLSEWGVELISTGGLGSEPSRRCADGCGNGRCAIGLEPTRRGGTTGFGTSPGYLAAPGHHLRPVHNHARRVTQITWLAGAVLVGVYKINASNAMPKPYLTVYIYTYVRVVYLEQYLQTHANANKRTQTHRCN